MGVLSYEKFENSAPDPCLPKAFSARGLVTEMRLKTRIAQNIHQKILTELDQSRSLSGVSTPFEWDLRQLPDAPEEVEVQARKLTDYLLNPAHPVGKSKARFFEKELGITQEDSAFLHAQLVDGLANFTFEQVRLDNYGIRFTANLPVKGRNGASVSIETGWIIRPGNRASLVTAYPGKKNEALESQATDPLIVSSEVAGETRWQVIYDMADEAGRRAMETCVPKPLVTNGDVIMEGHCGGAFIIVNDGRKSFAQWLKKNGLGNKHYPTGYSIPARQIGQAAETAKAYADAFARVLRRNGIECSAEIYFT
jgi:hypothetical protein